MDLVIWIGSYGFAAGLAVLTFWLSQKETVLNGKKNILYIGKKDSLKEVVYAIGFALLFMAVNFICTKTGAGYGGDRTNYEWAFTHGNVMSRGLEVVYNLVRHTTGSFEHVMYFTTFVCVFITLFSFLKCEDRSVTALVFLLTTDCVFFTFTALKQCYSCAFAALIFMLLTKKRSIARNIVCIALVILAFLFHPTGIILLPFLVLCYPKKMPDKLMIAFIAVIVLGVVFFKQIGVLVSYAAKPFSVKLYKMLEKYFREGNKYENLSRTVFVKGAAYYLLFGLGIFFRKEIKEKVTGYDRYLIVLGLSSAVYLCSFHEYWSYRLVYYFMVPAGLFAGILFKNIENKIGKLLALSAIGINGLIFLRWIYLIYVNYGMF